MRDSGYEFEMEIVASHSSRLKEAIAKRGVTQAKISRMCDIPTSVMTRYVKGTMKPKPDRLGKIADYLNVSRAWLEGYNVPMDRVAINNPYYKPDSKMSDVDKALGYGLVRQVYEAVKDLDDVQIKKVLTFIGMIK